MNKRSCIILKIAILSVISVLILAIMLFFLAFRWDNIDWFSYESKYKLVLSKTYLLNEIDSINFDLTNADADIRYSDTDSIKIDVYDKDESRFNLDSNNKVLNLKFEKFSTFCIGFCFSDRRVVLYLPESFKGDMKVASVSGDIEIMSFSSNMKISSVSGDIKVSGSKSLDVSTTSGDININDVKDLKVKSVSGDIDVVGVDNLEGSTTSGELDVFKLNNYINFSSISGDIDLNHVLLNKNSRLSTVSGDVEIKDINSIYISTTTTSGDVDIYNNDRYSSVELSIKTTSGDIEVR